MDTITILKYVLLLFCGFELGRNLMGLIHLSQENMQRSVDKLKNSLEEANGDYSSTGMRLMIVFAALVKPAIYGFMFVLLSELLNPPLNDLYTYLIIELMILLANLIYPIIVDPLLNDRDFKVNKKLIAAETLAILSMMAGDIIIIFTLLPDMM